jgi:hypothetical protein
MIEFTGKRRLSAMSTLSSSGHKLDVTHAVLAGAAALIFIAVSVGINERLGIGDTVAFWALFAAGMLLCVRGPLGRGGIYGWWNPLHIAGYGLGVLIMLLGLAQLVDVALPGISSVHGSVLVLGLLMILKGALAMFYRTRPAARTAGKEV